MVLSRASVFTRIFVAVLSLGLSATSGWSQQSTPSPESVGAATSGILLNVPTRNTPPATNPATPPAQADAAAASKRASEAAPVSNASAQSTPVAAPAQTTPPAPAQNLAEGPKNATAPADVVRRPGGAASNFRDFGKDLFSAGTFVKPAVYAGIYTYATGDKPYGVGAAGFGYRYGVSFADDFNSKFLRDFAMPTLFNQSQRYEPLGSGNATSKRFWHAVAHTFVTKTRNGTTTINMSGIPSSVAVGLIGNNYYPDEYSTLWQATQRGAYSQAGYFLSDFWSEFKPEICHGLHLPCGRRK